MSKSTFRDHSEKTIAYHEKLINQDVQMESLSDESR